MKAIGRLRERITIQTATTTADSLGGQSPTWSTLVSNVPAAIDPLTGDEALRLRAITALAPYRVTIRYRKDVNVTEKLRVQWTNDSTTVTLEVHSVANEGARDRALVMTCARTA